MNWSEQIDAYCERTDLTLWSEPVNAVTNAAFLIAAIVMWRRTGGLPAARALCAILFAIGIGSTLFHTFATLWASTADVVPIALFILFYLFLVNRDVMGWPAWVAGVATLGFMPYAIGIIVLLRDIPFLGVSSFYWTVPLLLLIYGVFLRRPWPRLARGFLIGAGILSLSITLRSLDAPLCDSLPMGTHFFWHILNALMLAWMIEVYRAHMLEAPAKHG